MAEVKKVKNAAAPKAEAKTEDTKKAANAEAKAEETKPAAKAAAKPKTAPKPKAAPKKPQVKSAPKKSAPKAETAEPKTETKQSEPKSAPKASASAAQIPNDFARMVVGQLVEAQRMWLELTTQQTALVVKTVTDVMGLSNNAPTEQMAEYAKKGVEGFIAAQKQWSEIALQQGEKLMQTVQSGANFGGGLEAVGTAQEAVGKGLETLVNLRTAWLDFAENQNKQMVAMLKQNLNLDKSSPVSAVADFAQQTMSSYVEIQKRWLDMATQMPIFGTNKAKK